MAISKLAAVSAVAVLSFTEAKIRPQVLFGDQYQEWEDEEPIVSKSHAKKVRSPTV